MNAPARGSTLTGLLVGLAALIAAVALLIFALSSAGIIGGPPPAATPVDAPASPTAAADSAERAVEATATAEGSGSVAAETAPAETTAAATESTAVPPGASAYTTDTPVAMGPTARPAATPGPSPTPRSLAPLVIEDWAAYEDDEALQAAYNPNEGWADNRIELALLDAAASPNGTAGAEAGYDIRAAAPNDYVGFERDLQPPQSWRDYSHLAVWAVPSERSNRQLVVQWHERSGEVWRHRTKLGAIPADGPLVIPLQPEAWEWADWSDVDDGELDLDQVGQFGIFIGHDGTGSGTLRLGTIELVQAAAGG